MYILRFLKEDFLCTRLEHAKLFWPSKMETSPDNDNNLPYMLKWRIFIEDGLELRGARSDHRDLMDDEERARRYFRSVVRKFIEYTWRCHLQLWRRSDHILLAEYRNYDF